MNQKTFSNLTVGEIVKENFQTAEIFKKYDIDFCCGGKATINEVCSENKISADKLIQDLNEAQSNPDSDTGKNFKDWESDYLINYIINVHHKYVNENLPLLSEWTNKIAQVHGERHPELQQIAKWFHAISVELRQHMMKEENILFPYIVNLYHSVKNNSPVSASPFGTVRNSIRIMEMEHVNAGSLLKKIREISNNYKLPTDACETYKVTYKKLDEFENDLHQHIHLENNILFPRAIELEVSLV